MANDLTKAEVAQWIRELVPYLKNPVQIAPKGCYSTDITEICPGKVLEYDTCLMPKGPEIVDVSKGLEILVALYMSMNKSEVNDATYEA